MISAVVRRGVYRGCAAAAETAGDASNARSASELPSPRGGLPKVPAFAPAFAVPSLGNTSGGNRTPLLRTWSYTSCRCGCLICCAHSRMSTSSLS